MDAQFRIEESMKQLRQNLEKARRDPQAVVEGEFPGRSPSGLVSVWVDALGRVQRIQIAPGSFAEGSEKLIVDEFMAANSAARRAAENLDFDGAKQDSRSRTESVNYADDYYEGPESFLESGY